MPFKLMPRLIFIVQPEDYECSNTAYSSAELAGLLRSMIDAGIRPSTISIRLSDEDWNEPAAGFPGSEPLCPK